MADVDRILVVDDEPAIGRLIARMLASETRNVETSESAEDVLPKLGNNAYDLYILDKNLPGMSGVALAEEVRKVDRAAGILILTGYASRDSALDALHVGVDGYAEKPVRRETLVSRVEDALAAAQRRRSLSDRLRTARAAARTALEQLKPRPLAILVANPDRALARRMADRLGPVGDAATVTDLSSLQTRLAGPPLELLLVDTSLAEDLTSTLRQAHERYPQLAIVVTGRAPSLQQVQSLIFAGVRAVIEEPITASGLHERLERELAHLRNR